jgi:hypothetical protein
MALKRVRAQNKKTKRQPPALSSTGSSDTTNKLTESKNATSDITSVLTERGRNYGDFRLQGSLSQYMKYCCRQHRGWNDMSGDQQEAIDMILHKIARIVNGNPNYKDSWTDIIGYATLIERRLT